MIRNQQGELLELVHFGLHWRVHRGICDSNDEIYKVSDPSAVLHLQMRARAFTQCCMHCLITMKGRPPKIFQRAGVAQKSCSPEISVVLRTMIFHDLKLSANGIHKIFLDKHGFSHIHYK